MFHLPLVNNLGVRQKKGFNDFIGLALIKRHIGGLGGDRVKLNQRVGEGW